jgi:hypothetical protein
MSGSQRRQSSKKNCCVGRWGNTLFPRFCQAFWKRGTQLNTGLDATASTWTALASPPTPFLPIFCHNQARRARLSSLCTVWRQLASFPRQTGALRRSGQFTHKPECNKR